MQRLSTDGTIVSTQPVHISLHPEVHDRVEITKITYLVDHLQVIGYIAKPSVSTARSFPVLIYNRGGFRSFSKINDATLVRIADYAARGYVVLASQYRGNAGGAGRDEYGGSDVKDLFALAWLAESLPEADATRLLMFGHSRGGMMTYLSIGHGLNLTAAAVVAAPTDLARRPLPHALEQLYGGLFGEPADNPDAYRARSALHWPERLTVPLLIQHGGQDRRVYPIESEQLVERLQTLGLPHQYIYYPDGDHFLQNVQQERDEAIFQWFEKFLT
ncbi:alpha/beta hydrolase family protein [Tumebacillus algifaecis]|nr:prolyl oligopeptidase family serine peptidase [Tumebacillus algifaecis]